MMKRETEAQIRPAARAFADAAILPIFTASTPLPINTGALPPSSINTGFIASAANSVRCLPTSVDPVKVTSLTTGEAISTRDSLEDSPNTRLRTPGGRPASSKHFTSAQAVAGVSFAGLSITEQPAARAPLVFLAAELIGTFQGVMASTGP